MEGYNSCARDPPILETQNSESNWTPPPPFSDGDRRYGQDFQKPTHPNASRNYLMLACLLRASLGAPSSVPPVGGILAGTKVEREVRLRVLDSCLSGLSSAPTDKKDNGKGDWCQNNFSVPLQTAMWLGGGEKGTHRNFPRVTDP